MVGSTDSLDCCFEMPPVTEKNAIPLDCWQDVCLSKIWIPSHLLPNRSKANNKQINQSIFHTLERKDFSKYNQSFSVYSLADVETELGEVYLSDSEDIFSSDSVSFENLETLLDDTSVIADDADAPLSSVCSSEVGDINIENFSENAEINHLSFNLNERLSTNEQTLKSKKNKDKKVKKKPSKYIALDKFLEDTPDISQDYYCEKYFQSLMKETTKNPKFNSNLPLQSKAEFPDLYPEEFKFIHSDKKVRKENSELSFKCLTPEPSESHEINQKKVVDVEEVKLSMTEIQKCEKIVIENIPLDVTEEDILLILYGYGEIKNLSMVSDGNFFKANVEIDLLCDIDWVIECLNGSEPFGASSEVLKCYKQAC